MLSKDIMTKNVISIELGTTILGAISILVDNKISGAPVIDGEGALKGIVTEKDLIVSLDFLGRKHSENAVIDEFMTEKVITFAEEDKVEDIMRTIVSMNIKRVPIIKEGRVTGIVARRDILKSVRDRK
jgi:CBS domain-containing protein